MLTCDLAVEDLRIAVEEYIHPLRKAVAEKKEILRDDQITACFPLLEALFKYAFLFFQ